MSQKARILIFLPSFAGGGAERTILNILRTYDQDRFLIKVCLLDFNGHYSGMISEEWILNPSDAGSFSVSKSGNPFYSFFKFFSFILPTQYKAIKSFQPDILITVTESMNYISMIWRILGVTKNAKWMIRSGNNIFAEAKSKGVISGSILRFLLKKAYTKADYIITLTQGAKDKLVSVFSLSKESIQVLYNPVDVKSIQQKREESIPHSFKYILGVGRLAPQKNFELLIEAYHQSIARSQNIHLVLLGEGSELTKLKKITSDLGIQEMVHFEGFQENPYSYMNQAEAFVLTSKWEGFGHVIAEAMASGCPVISVDCDFGPAEILENGTYGFLTGLDDAPALADLINKVVELPAEQRSMLQKKGFERAKDFEIEKVVNQYQDFFSNILEKS